MRAKAKWKTTLVALSAAVLAMGIMPGATVRAENEQEVNTQEAGTESSYRPDYWETWSDWAKFHPYSHTLYLHGNVGAINTTLFGGFDPWGEDYYVETIIAEEGTVLPESCSVLISPYWGGLQNVLRHVKRIDLSKADASNVTDMSSMFSYLGELETVDLSSLDTSKVVDMSEMFCECGNLKTVTWGENFNTSNVTNMKRMFWRCKALEAIDVSGFNTKNATDLTEMFSECDALESLDLSGFDTSNVKSFLGMFSYCASLKELNCNGFDFQQSPSCNSMFHSCGSLTDLQVNWKNTAGNMYYLTSMFQGCGSLTTLDLSSFDTSNVEDMDYLFSGCSSLTELDVSGFDTSKCKSLRHMFEGCSSLTELDVSGFDTQLVEFIDEMFSGCSSLIQLDVSNFNVYRVDRFDGMFKDCASLTKLNVNGWTTRLNTSMEEMFSGCRSLTVLNLGSFRTPGNLPRMFYGCSKLQKIIVHYEFDPRVYESEDAFAGCVALVGGNGTKYDPEHVDAAYAHVDRQSNPGYFTESARAFPVLPEAGTSFVDGETAVFQVLGFGDGLKYQWQTRMYDTEEWKNTTLSGYNTDTLKVVADYGKNGKRYRCVVTDQYGNVAASDQVWVLYLSVEPIETVIQPLPEETYATEGETVKIHVDATGKGLKYQWMTLDAGSSDWKKTTLTGYNTDTLTVKADSAKNGKQYCCAVTDKYGNLNMSSATTLVVNAQGLAISAHPQDVTVSAGSTATFTVTATGKKLKYQWQTLQVGATEWKNTTLTGYSTATLKVSADVSKSGRQYRCIVKDGSGDSVVSDAATLTVTSGPSIKTQPSDVTVNPGETATFSIKAAGTGLKYQWQTLQVGAVAWKNTTLTGYNTATLKVKADASKTGRQYRCIVTDQNGKTVTSNAATLTVNGGLAITTQPADVETTSGKTATFTVKATGEGLKYQWQTMHAGATEWKNTTVTGYNTATLKVGADANKNGRTYRCVITDKNGKTVTSNAATLTVRSTNGENYVR